MMDICPTCGRRFKGLRVHFSRSTACARGYYISGTNNSATGTLSSIFPPIPTVVNTGPSLLETAPTIADLPHSLRSRLRPRHSPFNYTESARKRACTTSGDDDGFPTPDDNLGDYISTFFDNEEQRAFPSSSLARTGNSRPPLEQLDEADMLELAQDSWMSLYGSIAAVAPPAATARNAEQAHANILHADPTPTLALDGRFGTVTTVTMVQQNSRVVAKPEDRSMARIYRLCDDARSPRYLADTIVRQIRKEMILNDFDPCHPGLTLRDSFMHRASKSIGSLPPDAIPITLESGQKVTVYRFPFLQFYQEHLLSSPFSDVQNLSVDVSNPWGYYTSSPDILKDIHDGIWYNASYNEFCETTTNHERYCFSPLAGYIDKTGTDGVMKNGLEPLMFISTNLKQSQREDSSCWFPGGFIPNLTMISAAGRRGQKARTYSRSASVRDYHRCMEVLLQPLKDLQRDCPGMYFRRGNQIMYKQIFCPFAGMLGDNASHDTLTGRMGDYGRTTPRLSRRCLTEFDRAGDSIHLCYPVRAQAIEYLSMAALGSTYGVRKLPNSVEEETTMYLRFASIPISDHFEQWAEFLKTVHTKTARKKYIRVRRIRQKLCDLILHKVYGSHAVDNAFFGLDFGSNKDGIFRATLTDILHAIQEGLVPKVLLVFYGLMADKQRAAVDDLVEALFCEGHNRSSERNAYPRVSFTRGYTQLTMLSADERIGQLFVLSFLLQTESGRKVLGPRFHLDFDLKRDEKKEQLSGIQQQTIFSEASLSSQESNSEQSDAPGDSTGGEGETVDRIHQTDTDHSEEDKSDDNATDDSKEDESNDSASGDNLLSECQIEAGLDHLDLTYIHNQIRPNLDHFHRQRLDKVLHEVLTKSAFQTVLQVQIPHNLLDYRTIPNLAEPVPLFVAATQPDKALPGFKVEEARDDNSIKLPMDQFLYVVESILSLHAFLKYGCSLLLSSPTGIAEYKRVLELFLRILVSTIDRGEDTNQWCLQKTLELVHFLEDVLFFGPASGFSTETGERGLKQWAKAPARTAQNRSDEVFSKQVCMRIHERVLINAVADAQPLEEDVIEEEVLPSTKVRARCANFVVELEPMATIIRVLSSGKKHKIQIDFPVLIVAWFEKHFRVPAGEAMQIQLYTEIVLPGTPGQSGTLIRAHPNYQSDGAWYDYALARYDEDNREDCPSYPCKTACFFKDPNTSKIMALVQEVDFQSPLETVRESQLFDHWTLKSKTNRTNRTRDAVLKAIPVDCLSDRIYALDPKPLGGFRRQKACDFRILVVKYVKEQWPTSFLKSPAYFESYRWD